jgi:hypothetical protein
VFTKLLASNGCFSGSLILTVSLYVTIAIYVSPVLIGFGSYEYLNCVCVCVGGGGQMTLMLDF